MIRYIIDMRITQDNPDDNPQNNPRQDNPDDRKYLLTIFLLTIY